VKGWLRWDGGGGGVGKVGWRGWAWRSGGKESWGVDTDDALNIDEYADDQEEINMDE
jgi:hypothetical protein